MTGVGAAKLVSVLSKTKAGAKIANALKKLTKGLDKVEVKTKGLSKSDIAQKVIGHYPEYVDLSNKLGTKSFSIPDNIWNKKFLLLWPFSY